MVVTNGGRMRNVDHCSIKNDNNLNSNVDSDKMSAKGILICRDNSHAFQDRTLNLDQAIKIGRSVARTRAAADNAIFDCKVLSRNHALLWYNAGKFYLRDTRSSNGTFVNNQRLSATGSESAAKEVCSGDIVQFGVDVVESTKKVTHGCIIATLKLYLPDGKEAKASRSMFITSPAGDVTLEDLYKLNQFVQEANKREKVLHSKLLYLQKLVENTRNAASQSWKALIDEDRLLSRVKTVECQLVVYSKNFTDDKVRGDLLKLEEEKSSYQIAAKEALQRIHQEKLEVTQKLIQLECRLNETEEECQSLHEISKHAQVELQQLAAKYSDAQKNLAQIEEKLAEQEQSSTEIVKWAVQENQEMFKKVVNQSMIGRLLQYKVSDNRSDSVKIQEKLTGLKNYIQTFQDLNTKLLSDEPKDGSNPVKVINDILDIVNRMLAPDEENIDDSEHFENLDDIKYLDSERVQKKLHEIDFNQKLVSKPHLQSSCGKKELDNLACDSDNFAAYILPPTNPRRTLMNGNVNIVHYDQEQDLKSDVNDGMLSDTGDTDASSSITTRDLDGKTDITNETANRSNVSETLTDIADKSHVKFLHNLCDPQLRIQHYDVLNIHNRLDDDDSSDSADSPNESISLIIPTQEKHSEITTNLNNDESINASLALDEVSLSPGGLQSMEVDGNNTEVKPDRKFCDRVNAKEKETNDTINSQKIENYRTLASVVHEKNDEIGISENEDDNNIDVQIKQDSAEEFKSMVPERDNSMQDSNTKEFILYLFTSSLELLNDDVDIEVEQLVKNELHELRNWLSHESYDIVVEKFTAFYFRAKKDKTRMLEMDEELVILKEKYNRCHEEKTDLFRKYAMLEAQCGDILNASYSVPIQYFVPVAIAFLWMLFEHVF